MKKAIISFVVLLACAPGSYAAGKLDLKETAPTRYTVVRGDTLWSIAGHYLKNPWEWPKLWRINGQIRNPHLIYPGDVLILTQGHPVGKKVATGAAAPAPAPVIKLEPRVHVESNASRAIPAIPPDVIAPFLSKPLVVGEHTLDAAPRIVATEGDRVVLGAGDIAYAKGITKDKGSVWQIYRRGDALVDPASHKVLGYAATYVGEARVRRFGALSTIEIIRSNQEVYEGDRLLPATQEKPTFGYVPHAPRRHVSAYIISIYGGLMETGPLSIVTLSKGSSDGLEKGDVLALYRNETTSRRLRSSPLWGRTGPTGSDAPRTYYSEELTPRDGPLFSRGVAVTPQDVIKLPPERYGLVMVFRTFEHVSFGLVMKASRPVSEDDIATNP